jgi:hypothetical protein
MDDQLLLDALNDLDAGTLQNVIQAARELDGTLSERLSMGYHECTAKGFNPDDEIGLIDPDDGGDD